MELWLEAHLGDIELITYSQQSVVQLDGVLRERSGLSLSWDGEAGRNT